MFYIHPYLKFCCCSELYTEFQPTVLFKADTRQQSHITYNKRKYTSFQWVYLLKYAVSITVLLKCKWGKHISNIRLLYLKVLTLFLPQKILFPCFYNAETYITTYTYICTFSEWKKNRSNIQEEWQNGLQGHGRNIVFVQASLCKAQLYRHLRWCDAFLRVNEHEECIQYTYKTYRLWSFCFTVWKLQDMHKTSIMSNRLLHVSNNPIWIAHTLPEYENFINCDQSTEVKDNCLFQFISEHKNMHTHTHTHTQERDGQRYNYQWILK